MAALRRLGKLTYVVVAGLLAGWLGSAQAAYFNIAYDADVNGIIDTPVGSGFISYDGLVTAGSFALASLDNFAFGASFINGASFTTGDIVANPATAGIFVFSLDTGGFGMVLTGNGEGPSGGSLDATVGDFVLSHEPTADIGTALGCCGGNGVFNLYFARASAQEVGNTAEYAATTVPVPGSLWLLASALTGLGLRRRRQA